MGALVCMVEEYVVGTLVVMVVGTLRALVGVVDGFLVGMLVVSVVS